MKDFRLTDDFGRVTRFRGIKLVNDTTDNSNGEKPQFTNITVWRTEAGQYVVLRETCYRIRHLHEYCYRAENEGAVLREPHATDNFPCSTCNKDRVIEPGVGYGQLERSTLVVYKTPQQLIDGLATLNVQTGMMHHSNFVQAVLADISEEDEEVHKLWMVQEIR